VVEAELVEQILHRSLGVKVVARDDERAAVLRIRRLPVGSELRGVDMVERLDDLRREQMRLQELGRPPQPFCSRGIRAFGRRAIARRL
jgi:hypothetical protein